MIRAQGEAQSAEMIGQAIARNPGFIELRRIEAARDIASTISSSANRVYLTSDSLLLNLLPSKVLEPKKWCIRNEWKSPFRFELEKNEIYAIIFEFFWEGREDFWKVEYDFELQVTKRKPKNYIYFGQMSRLFPFFFFLFFFYFVKLSLSTLNIDALIWVCVWMILLFIYY